MTECFNNSAQIKVKEELEYGVEEQAGFYSIDRVSFNLDSNITQIDNKVLKEGRGQTKTSLGSQDVSGNLTVPLDDTASYLFNKALFGNATITPVGDKFEQVFTKSDKCLTSLQFEETKKSDGITFKTTGVKVNKMSLSFSKDAGVVEVSYDLLGIEKYMNKILVDDIDVSIEVDAAINTKTLDVDNVTGYEAGDIIVIPHVGATLTADVEKSRQIQVDNTTGLSKYDFIEINGKEYQIQTVGSTTIFLNRPCTALLGQTVNVLNNEYTIESIDELATTITLVSGIKKAVSIGDVIYVKKSISEFLTGNYFDNSRVSVSTDDGIISQDDIETFSFIYSNEQQKIKTIGIDRIADGITMAEATFDVIVKNDIALMLEKSKNDYKFNLTINIYNTNGNTYKLELFNCQVIPGDFNQDDAIVKVSITAKPYDDVNGYVRVTQISDIGLY